VRTVHRPGVSGLRVADASIIPEVPSATTNVTVIMLAERIYQRVYASRPRRLPRNPHVDCTWPSHDDKRSQG
jgi:choline dehydrogenase-like flavoprotein